MNLIYINKIGSDYTGSEQYEFIFSDFDGILDMDSWFTIPASMAAETLTPDVEYISIVGLLKNTDLHLELIQESDTFGVIDAVDGVIALGWETLILDDENQNRLSFHFGENAMTVVNKLKERNYILIKEVINTEEVNEEIGNSE